jgi:hypothetical protein
MFEKNMNYLKNQAKNLYRDFQLEYKQDDEEYVLASRFFDINAIVEDFNIDCDDFSLMKAQHIIAKMLGLNSWKEVIDCPEDILTSRIGSFNTENPYKITRLKVYNLDLSNYEKIDEGKGGDYILKCPRLPELIEIIETVKPTGYFQSCGSKCLDLIDSDKEHFYVNVTPQWSQIRVAVPGYHWPDYYVAIVRNIGNM